MLWRGGISADAAILAQFPDQRLMSNPYHGRPDYTFWRRSVSNRPLKEIDPVVRSLFKIDKDDPVATAGSCFAQHISRTLASNGFNYLVTEKYDSASGTTNENFGVYPARFSNIYTARQLLQLFDRAYGRFTAGVKWLSKSDGRYIDPFRPLIQEKGYDSIDHLLDDGIRHLRAVREMFEKCKVFIFTLGLTEAWVSKKDGSVYPLASAVVTEDAASQNAVFYNFGVSEIVDDLRAFIDRVRSINAQVRIILTVSPVPLIATYEDRHVIISTIASKSILRAAVEEVMRSDSCISYFPSYEIITGPQSRGEFYESDLREITATGVEYVMSVFTKHYLYSAGESHEAKNTESKTIQLSEEDKQRMAELAAIICDEEEIVR